jgi:hypothetical protein
MNAPTPATINRAEDRPDKLRRQRSKRKKRSKEARAKQEVDSKCEEELKCGLLEVSAEFKSKIVTFGEIPGKDYEVVARNS